MHRIFMLVLAAAGWMSESLFSYKVNEIVLSEADFTAGNNDSSIFHNLQLYSDSQ